MERIKRLNEETINKIAAGEVIDRPASVIKELVENSLDAGSTSVSVSVEDAGLSLIEVADNGFGMEPGELIQALLRHTTSKIRDVADLMSIASFGFRGEALASIAAVSKLEIRSIPEGKDRGLEISVAGGKITGERTVFGESGTVVNVRDLFFNTPARKKFLRSRKVELGNIRAAFWDLAVPCAGIYFLLKNDGVESLSVPADLDTRNRVYLKEHDIVELLHGFNEVSPYFALHGLITSPIKTFPRTNRISLFVNKRGVRDGMGVAAVKEGMRGLIPENRYPSAYVFIEVSPEEADFNVHPSKKEVRFRYRKELFELISYAIKKRFVREGNEYRIDKSHSPDEGEYWVPPERGDVRINREREARETPPFSGWSSVSSPATEKEMQHELFNEQKPLSQLKIIGQVLGNYILIDGGEELFFLDIHAASERVHYGKVRKGYGDWLEHPEHLLISVTIPVERLGGNAEDVKEVLVDAGYLVEFEEDVLKITAVPVYLKGLDPLAVVEDLLEILKSGSPDGATETEKVLEELMARIACHASLRGTHKLHEEEMRYLLEELERANYSQTCPHGRPVFIKVSRRDLHKLFGRT